MYAEHEKRKVRVRENKWECGYCRKAFRSEAYLDMHMDNRHADQLPPPHFAAHACAALGPPAQRLTDLIRVLNPPTTEPANP
eukprot:SM005208S17863  [mRNA]  locus=s5208:333:821:- [translate_table: standard]